MLSNPALAKRPVRLVVALVKLWQAERALEAAREEALRGNKKIAALRAEQKDARARLAELRRKLEGA
ncbi:MAG: hypothetical protein QXG98_05855 [Candidatus Micrarchaeia archaeon]